jgi:Protein of unknown function (DUF429)
LPDSPILRLARFDLTTIARACCDSSSRTGAGAIAVLSKMLQARVPQLRGAIVLVDSPRWPRDLDWSNPQITVATDFKTSREIDRGLRALVSRLHGLRANPALTLSMFPTPPMSYFGAHIKQESCKSHLRLFGHALFGETVNRDYGPALGGTFTRFMISGFATYRALQNIAAGVYESYPDLQFRLWCRGRQLISKKRGRAASLPSRIRVLGALARQLAITGLGGLKQMDEADAAILALGTAAARQHGAIVTIDNATEGSFLIALDAPDARYLALDG